MAQPCAFSSPYWSGSFALSSHRMALSPLRTWPSALSTGHPPGLSDSRGRPLEERGDVVRMLLFGKDRVSSTPRDRWVLVVVGGLRASDRVLAEYAGYGELIFGCGAGAIPVPK